MDNSYVSKASISMETLNRTHCFVCCALVFLSYLESNSSVYGSCLIGAPYNHSSTVSNAAVGPTLWYFLDSKNNIWECVYVCVLYVITVGNSCDNRFRMAFV